MEEKRKKAAAIGIDLGATYSCVAVCWKKEANNLLGAFVLHGIPAAPKHDQKFNVYFWIDENGILTVSAQHIGTNNKKKITITEPISRLPKEEIARLVGEAERYRADDKQYLKKAEAKNSLENYVIMMMDVMKDLEGKMRVDDKRKMEVAIKKTRCWLDRNFQVPEAFKFEEKMEELWRICEPIIVECNTRPKKYQLQDDLVDGVE